jgi:ribokinase
VAGTARIAVVGSINTDLVVYTLRLPRPGETALGGDLQTFGGGKGANQAVAAARLGATVRMIGRVGDDDFGRVGIANLARHRVDVEGVLTTEGAPSGVALIVVDERGENLIALAPGANLRLTAADVERAWNGMSGCSILLLQLEVPLEANVRAAELGRAAKMTVILNPAPAPRTPLPAGLLGAVDVVVPNESEAATLTGVAVADPGSAERAGRELLAMGPPAAIVTLGPRGARLITRDGAEHVPAVPLAAVDTTAAGDAFCGGLAFALARGDGLSEAARYAAHVAALSVTRRGAQDSMPSAAEVAASMAGAGA